MIRRLNQVALSLLIISLPLQASDGGIRLGQTRVIFSASDKSQTVTVSNSGKRAYLIQSRVQNGPDDNTPAPFIVTPPLFALQGEKNQLLRILPQNLTLPTDRESLFYFSVSAIPAMSEPQVSDDRLSVGVRFLVKLLYRPDGLAEANACQLTFSKDKRGVRITNPSPYYHTLGALSINGRSVALEKEPVMVSPKSSHVLSLNGPLKHIVWQTITDYGGLSSRCQQTHSAAVETKS